MKKPLLEGLVIGIVVFTLTAVTGLPVIAEVIYDNSLSPHINPTTGQVDFITGPEMGDEITLGGTERIVTQFDFALFVTSPSPTGEIHFYSNDGSGGAPSTPLYSSGPINIIDGWNSLTGLFVTVPDTFTWTFDNLTTPPMGTFVGMRVYDPPTIGSSGDFFWFRNFPGSAWNKGSFPDLPDNFGAKIIATEGFVPEPSTLLLLGSGLVGLAGYGRKKFFKK